MTPNHSRRALLCSVLASVASASAFGLRPRREDLAPEPRPEPVEVDVEARMEALNDAVVARLLEREGPLYIGNGLYLL